MAFNVGSAVGYLMLDTSKWTKGLNDARMGLKTFEDQTTKAVDRFMAMGASLNSAGKVLTLGVTAPLAGIGAMAAKSATDWETAWTGVTKTVDGTTEQMEALEDALFEISKRTASTPAEIAAVAEAAGQLGIQQKNIATFAETMTQLGDTTNLSSDEAATALARFANITGMSQDRFGNLGSVIVDLGNNFATTEAEIVELGARLAGAGNQIGLTESEIMGFAAALSSVGIQAEAGGTALSKVFVDMQLAVETGNESLKDFADVAGMTTDQFAQKFKEDAAGAVQDFIVGLSKSEEQGKSAIAVLDEMGISEVRLRDTLLRASSASDLFNSALDTANTAWEENNALTEEANKRYGTFDSKMAQLKSSTTELMVSLGELLLPAITGIVDGIGNLVNWLNTLDEDQKRLVLGIATAAAAIGPLLIIVGKLSTAISGIITFISGAGGITAALSSLVNPVTIVIAAIGALALAWTMNFGGIQEKTQEIFSCIQAIIQTVMAAIRYVWENDLFGIKTIAEDIWNAISTLFEDALNIITDVFNIFSDLFSGNWTKLWEDVKQLFSDVWQAIYNAVGNFLNLIVDIIIGWGVDLFIAASTAISEVAKAFEEVWNGIVEWFKVAINDPIGTITSIGASMYEAGKSLFSQLWEGIKSVWESIKSWVEEKVKWLTEKIQFWNKASAGMSASSVASNRVTGTQTPTSGTFKSGLNYSSTNANVKTGDGGTATKAQEGKKSSGGDTYNFYSPEPLTPVKAAREFKRVKQELALGY